MFVSIVHHYSSNTDNLKSATFEMFKWSKPSRPCAEKDRFLGFKSQRETPSWCLWSNLGSSSFSECTVCSKSVQLQKETLKRNRIITFQLLEEIQHEVEWYSGTCQNNLVLYSASLMGTEESFALRFFLTENGSGLHCWSAGSITGSSSNKLTLLPWRRLIFHDSNLVSTSEKVHRL